MGALTISRRSGNGSPAITLGVYGHLFKADDRAAEAMEKTLALPNDQENLRQLQFVLQTALCQGIE